MTNSTLLFRKKSFPLCSVIPVIFPLLVQAQRQPGNIISPEIQANNSVTFRLKVSNADSVQVFGSWPPEFKNIFQW